MADKHRMFQPTAPDLQVYRPTLTMVMSIVHRATGAALYLGMALWVAWLAAVAAGPETYAAAQRLTGAVPGRILLLLLTWALLQHVLGGVRHLIQDTGLAHDHPWREYLARATLSGSVALTILLWIVWLA